MQPIVVWWCRRDLRLGDNRALALALSEAQQRGGRVLPVFIFDRAILDELPRADARVVFIHQRIEVLQRELGAMGGGMLVRYGQVEEEWAKLLAEYPGIQLVVAGRDSEPYALSRDAAIHEQLAGKGASLQLVWDHVLRAPEEVLTGDARAYRVFTPYRNAWVKSLPADAFAAAESTLSGELLHPVTSTLPTLAEMGFEQIAVEFPEAKAEDALLKRYAAHRNSPAIRGTSRLGLHLRFGTISVRALARQAQPQSETYVNELIWRDFYQMILHHFPHVATRAFKPEYERIPWRDDAEDFGRWCRGETGYPLVDAGMRELNATGFMHNRVRMVVASFLTKHLLIDWRLGEAYFAEKLLDFELASNNGGWQWAAGTGVDAAPYFRIFNPSEQTKKFDPKLEYVRLWVPEYDSLSYQRPMVDHAFARARALDTYKRALQPG